jgi:hypothetical protein
MGSFAQRVKLQQSPGLLKPGWVVTNGQIASHQLVKGLDRLQSQTFSLRHLPFLKVAAMAQIKPIQKITLVEAQGLG